MSSGAIKELGPPGIHSVVMASSAARKIKDLSSSLFAERQKLNQGGFALTFTDDPTNPPENLLQSKLAGREQVLSELGQSSVFSEHISDSELENASPRGRQHTTVTRPLKIVSCGAERLSEPQTYHTYRLEPQKKFEHWKVTEIIKRVFEEHLTTATYDREFCQHMSKITADSIKEQVKSLQFSRYKIIAVVSIGQKAGQSVRVASTFVWDPKFDCYAQYVFEKGDMYAFGVVYGIYCE